MSGNTSTSDANVVQEGLHQEDGINLSERFDPRTGKWGQSASCKQIHPVGNGLIKIKMQKIEP
jgi:hypothetical protein